jgi:hypothetical protein
MAQKNTAADAEKNPNDLIYMHHPKTEGVRVGKRRSLNVWGKKGWLEGTGKAKGLPPVPQVEGPIVVAEDGTASILPVGAADTATQTATAQTARQS